MSVPAKAKVFPQAEGVKSIAAWGGAIDTSPDSAPIIQKVGQGPGLVAAAGISGHGLSMGPVAGLLVANDTDTIAGSQSCLIPRF